VGATPQDPASLVTPDDARRAVADSYSLSYQAYAALDSAQLAQVESPPLLTINEADFQYRRAEDEPFENLVEEPSEVEVFVPRQTAYPLQFLARIAFESDQEQYLLYVRDAPDAPWRNPYQVFVSGFPGLPSPIAVDRDGYARLLDPGRGRLRTDPARLGERLTSFFGRYEEQPLPKSRLFRPGPATSDNLQGIRNRAREVQVTYTFSPVPGPQVAYATKNGGAFTFFAYQSQDQTLPPPGGTLRVRTGGFPGPKLPPGRYQSTEATRMTLLAAVVPPARQRREPVTVVGRYTGTLAADGVPLAPEES
jgi:hypothetical protein